MDKLQALGVVEALTISMRDELYNVSIKNVLEALTPPPAPKLRLEFKYRTIMWSKYGCSHPPLLRKYVRESPVLEDVCIQVGDAEELKQELRVLGRDNAWLRYVRENPTVPLRAIIKGCTRSTVLFYALRHRVSELASHW